MATSVGATNPFYLHPSDNPGTILVSKILDGTGFEGWKRSMMIALSAKNKIGFIDGSIIRHHVSNLQYRQWERANDMVISWILNSLSKDIAESVLYNTMASDIWNELCNRFGQSNFTQIYAVKKEINTIAQGSDGIATYFTRNKRLWDELFSLQSLLVCSCGSATILQKYEADQQLVGFLMGLNENYTSIRGNILMMSPIPTLAQVYSMLIQEEKQRDISFSFSISADTASFAVNSSGILGSKPKGDDKKNMVCNYCKKTGHLIAKCYKLHGFPPGFGSKNNDKSKKFSAHVESTHDASSSVPSIPGLSVEQCTQLMALLGQAPTAPEVGMCNMAGPFNEAATGSW